MKCTHDGLTAVPEGESYVVLFVHLLLVSIFSCVQISSFYFLLLTSLHTTNKCCSPLLFTLCSVSDEWFCRKCTAKRNIRLGEALAVENFSPPSFEDLLEKLKVFRTENGHFDVPPELEELHQFAEKLRESYRKRRKTALQLEHEEQLDKIGFNWPPTSNGSAQPTRPSSSVDETDVTQRASKSSSKSSKKKPADDMISAAAPRKNSQNIILIGPSKRNHKPPEYCGLGCSHGERQASWDRHLEELLEYGHEHGTYNVSKRHGDGDLYNWLQYQRYLFYKGETEGRSKGLGPAQRERYDKFKKVGIFIPLDDVKGRRGGGGGGGGGTKRQHDELNSGVSDSGSSSDSEESSTMHPQKRRRQNSQQITLIPPPKKGNPKPPTYDSTAKDGASKGESQKSWDMHLNELLKYGEKNGTYNVGKSYKGGDLYRWLQHQKWLFYKGEDEGRSKGLGPGQRHRYDKLKEADIFETR